MKKFDYYGGIFLSSIVLAVVVVLAEVSESFKTGFLETIGGIVTLGTQVHHWPGKLALLIVALLIGGFYLPKSEKHAWYATLGSLAVILLFSIAHFLGLV